MCSGCDPCPLRAQLLQNSRGKGSTLNGVSAGAKLVYQHKTAVVGFVYYAADIGNMR